MTRRFHKFSDKELLALADNAHMVEAKLMPEFNTVVGLRYVGGDGYHVAWLASGQVRSLPPINAVHSARELGAEPLYQPLATVMLEKADLALLLGHKADHH